MKKIALISVLLLSISSVVFSEIEVGISLGYGFGINGLQGDGILPYTDHEGTNSLNDVHYDKFKDEYTSLGNGLKIGVDGTLYLQENLGVMAAFELSVAGRTTAETKDENVDLNVDSTTNYKIVANHIAINVGLKIQTEWDIFSPYIGIAPGLYIPVGVDGTIDIKLDPGTDTKTDFEVKYAAGFGVKSILGAKIKLSDMISLKAELAPTFASARVKEYVTTDQNGNKITTIYEKNEEDIGINTADKIYKHGGPKHSFNSFGINVGIIIGL